MVAIVTAIKMTEKGSLSPKSKVIADHVQKVIDQYRWAVIVGFEEDTKGILSVALDFEVALPSKYRRAGVTPTGVRKTEPVLFRFSNFPLFAPSLRLRGDFNRNLPHVNPIADKSYVSPCIFNGGNLSDLMHREDGLFGVLHHMKDWLDRAARNGLYDDVVGWEPIVGISTKGEIEADLEISSAVCSSSRPIDEFVALFGIYGEGKYCYARLCESLSPPLKEIFPKEGEIGDTLAFVIWGDSSSISLHREVASISHLKDLYRWLSKLRVKGYLRSRIKKFIQKHKQGHSEEVLNFFVLAAIPRPVHVSGTSSKFEYLPFWISYPLTHKGEEEASASLLNHYQKVTPSFAAKLSGLNHQASEEGAIVMVGCGSLGSKLAVHMAKAGATPFHLIDNASYKPHNAIRHAILTTSSKKKADLLQEELKTLGVKSTCDHNNVVLSLQKSVLDPVMSSARLIIDSTASAQVRQALSLTTHSFSGRLVSAAFHSAGDASHLLLEGPNRNPRVDDLYAFMVSEADDSLVRKMFFNEDSALRPQPIGQGCASVTMIMSDAAASVQAAGNAKILLNYLTEPIPENGEVWFSLPDEHGVGAMWHRRSLGLTTIVSSELPDMDGWEVRILAPAIAKMESECMLRASTETGGALFGHINTHLRRITVTSSEAPPPDSKFSKCKFIMGTVGLRESTEMLERHTHGNLTFLGTWHSHTADSPPSSTDRDSLTKFSHLRQGPPFVMLVKTPNNLFGLVKSE